MILLLYPVLFHVPFVRASLQGLNDTRIHTLDVSDCPPSNARTLWDILSSCGLTLFACTWTVVHPSIPGIYDGVAFITFHRLYFMVVALFAPELVTFFAAMQFLSARKAAMDFNRAFGAQCARNRRAIWQSKLAVTLVGDIPNSSRSSSARWTPTHGFFAWMGGFVLYVDGEPRATLRPHELVRFVREGSVEMPTITTAEIEDRSKGDELSKCAAILQLVWFVIQLIARYAQGLPVTLLEIDTLGVATLACITYCFWLKKPKDIRRPYIVHWNSEVPAPPRGSLANDYLQDIHPFYAFAMSISTYHTAYDDGLMKNMSIITGCVSGMIFGAIHCLGWNYLFQANKEQILWRVASTGMACSPLMVTFIGFMKSLMEILKLEFELETSDQALLRTYMFVFGGLPFVLGNYLYMFSRCTIFVLVFLSLRSLPPGAYDTVAWTKFIPHVTS